MSSPSTIIKEMYSVLFRHFGHQGWWPGDTALEVCVGAILTQNTQWSNVEKAIQNLKKANVLDLRSLQNIATDNLAELIRPAGYFNIKAKRLKNFIHFVVEQCGTIEELQNLEGGEIRDAILSVNGIGPETADSILLYAMEKPFFVVDAYTKRILVRHRLMGEDAEYSSLQDFMERHFVVEDHARVKSYNEFHALIVATGKNYCHKSKPDCRNCPLLDLNGNPDVPAGCL